jgi:hypothetical protein
MEDEGAGPCYHGITGPDSEEILADLCTRYAPRPIVALHRAVLRGDVSRIDQSPAITLSQSGKQSGRRSPRTKRMFTRPPSRPLFFSTRPYKSALDPDGCPARSRR